MHARANGTPHALVDMSKGEPLHVLGQRYNLSTCSDHMMNSCLYFSIFVEMAFKLVQSI